MFLRPSVGNDSSQYGRVEGAVSGCRPAGPQNVGQVVSVCLVCSHLSLFSSSLPSQCPLPNSFLVSFVVFRRFVLLLLCYRLVRLSCFPHSQVYYT